MKRIIFLIFLFLFTSLSVPQTTHAIYDPLSRANNFFGIHILFNEELEEAAKLVNSNGGDWGYVTIPLQAGDRDIDKWQEFMNKAALYHITPIIRLSTEGYYANTSVWRKPDEYDLVDFANFLNSLSWPTKNRYVILFNEINRFDEWGGDPPEPSEYAQIVSSARNIFKSRSDDFFLIMGGFDNASVTDYKQYMNEYDYLSAMQQVDPDIFNKIDGFASHSYPNPAFSAYPNSSSRMGTGTFLYEFDFINAHANSKKYAFITETGWSTAYLSENKVSEFYSTAFDTIWNPNKDKIVAITPFLLKSENGQFDIFSFYKNGKPTKYYQKVASLPKAKGQPLENIISTIKPGIASPTRVIDFKDAQNDGLAQVRLPKVVKGYIRQMLGL